MNAKRTACMLALVLALAGVVAVSAALANGGGNPADIVISEVMFNAITETNPNNCGEWIEIYNKGSASIDLAGWVITDNTTARTITNAMCPNNSCQIPSKGCWLIAWNQNYLQTEFNHYTNPSGAAVDLSRTIFLSNPIGGGLANTTDTVALMIISGGVTLTVDCVSWGTTTPTFCSGLTYVPGGNGVDTALGDPQNKYDGQSITNIGGNWYRHQRNASPYNCINTAAGGSPTAVALSSFSARARPRWVGVALPLGILAGLKIAGKRKRPTGRRGKFP